MMPPLAEGGNAKNPFLFMSNTHDTPSLRSYELFLDHPHTYDLDL